MKEQEPPKENGHQYFWVYTSQESGEEDVLCFIPMSREQAEFNVDQAPGTWVGREEVYINELGEKQVAILIITEPLDGI